MHNEPRQQLCQLIAQYGPTLSEDPRRCGALLKDHCGQYKREIFVLVNALENRVATELLNASAGVPEVVLLSRLSKRLEDELGLAENAAKWAVETWALALGIIQQPLPISVPPNPAQTTQPVSQSTASPATVSSVPSAGGKLKFPRFSVGKVKIGGKEQVAVGEIDVPQGQTVELKVSEDMTDFSFLEKCDENNLVSKIILINCQIFRDDDLTYLINFNNLKCLEIINPYRTFGSNGLELINYFDKIENLALRECIWIGYKALDNISSLTNLEFLDLSQTGQYQIDAGLVHLGKLINLKTLNLSCTAISGPSVLANLGCMTHLKSLNLTGCSNLSNARLQELKQMLPNTHILP